MTRGTYRLRPVPLAVTLTGLVILIGLGFWQLDRAEQKRAMRERLDAAADTEPRQLTLPLPSADALQSKPVEARGRFDTSRNYLLANRMRDGESGYLVLTPLRVGGSATAVLVARDWVAGGPEREELPAVPPVPDDDVTVTGLATDGPAVGYRMGEAYAGDGDWPRPVTYLDYQAMNDALPYQLRPLVIDTEADAAQRKARLMGGVSPQRHTGYAVQWFGLAAALAIMYLIASLRRGASA